MNDKWYNNIFGTGTNIFGAGPSGSVRSLLDAKLITPESVEKAQKRSMSRGLLTGLASYLAQPQNQNYGSVVPYIAKGYLQGMEAAQSPYESLESDAIMKEKLDKLALEKQREQDIANLQNNLYTTEGGGTITTSDYQPIKQVGADGTTQIAPSFKPYNVQEMDLPSRKVLNKDALVDYAIKYGDQAGPLVDTLSKLQDMGTTDQVELEREYVDLLSRNDLSEPEVRRRDALATVLSKGPATEVNVSPKFNNVTGQKELEGFTGALYKNISEGEKVQNVRAAANDLVTYKNLGDAVSKGEFVGGGIFNTPKDFIARLGDELGLGGQDLDTKLENTRKIMKQFANAQLIAGAKLKGPPSEKEQDLLKMAADGKFDEMSPAQIADAMAAGQKVARQTIVEYNKDVDDLIALQERRLKDNPNDRNAQDLIFLLKRKKIQLPARIGKVTIKKK